MGPVPDSGVFRAPQQQVICLPEAIILLKLERVLERVLIEAAGQYIRLFDTQISMTENAVPIRPLLMPLSQWGYNYAGLCSYVC